MEDWSALNKLVIEGFWMSRISEKVTSFWFKGLSKDLHFSISHRPGDLYWNLHLTKNIDNSNDKPKITICKISTENLATNFEQTCQYLLSQMLEPLILIRNRRKQPGYLIRFEEIDKGKAFIKFRKELHNTFKNSTNKVGKKELRLTNNTEIKMTEWASSCINHQRILAGLKRLSRRFSKKPGSGLLITKKKITSVIIADGRLYKIKQGDSAKDIFTSLISPELLTRLHGKILFAIPRLLAATSYKQVERWDTPVEVSFSKITERPI